MDTKKVKIEGILNEEKDELIAFVVDGIYYEREESEDLKEFYSRVAEDCQSKGIDFHNTYMNSASIKTLTEQEYAKKIEKVLPATESVQSKINGKKAVAGAAALMLASFTLGTYADEISDFMKDKYGASADDGQESQYVINEENPKLKAVYEKILKYENGEEIVKRLELVDDTHARINQIAIENPDENGKVSYIEAEEVAAIHDVYNADTNQKTLLEDEDTIRCNYFTGQAALINLSQGSRDVQEIDGLFANPKLAEKQRDIQGKTQKTLDNLNIATPGFVNMLNEIYGTRGSNPELQSEVAFGQPGLAAAITPEMTGETLANFQEASKKEGGQLGELIIKASKDSKRAAVEDNEINLEKQDLINEAFEIMDEKQKLNEYDRTDYDPSTTEKGKDMVKEMLGDFGITSGGDIVQYDKTTNTRRKVSRDEAVNKFGEDKVKEKEDKVKVDTDGDGKNDKPLDDANEDSKEEADTYAEDYSKGYKAGQIAFTQGGSSTTSSGSQGYKDGYKAGYAHAKAVYDNQVKEEKETEETFVYQKEAEPEPEPEPEKPADEEKETDTDDSYVFEEEFVPETKTIKTIEREGEVYEMQPEETTSKTRTIGTNA